MRKIVSKSGLMLLALFALFLTSCTENYSNGERIGMVTKLSKSGMVCKTWEGHLNVTQTGNNSATVGFDFSIDRDNMPDSLVAKIEKAAVTGDIVKLKYHETFGWNWFSNRGDTDYFVVDCEILKENRETKPVNTMGDPKDAILKYAGEKYTGGDTLYVVLVEDRRK